MINQLHSLLTNQPHLLPNSSHLNPATASISALAQIHSQLRALLSSQGIHLDPINPWTLNAQASFQHNLELNSDNLVLISASMFHRDATAWALAPTHSPSKDLKLQALCHLHNPQWSMMSSPSTQQHLQTVTIKFTHFWRLCRTGRWCQ